MTPQWRRSAWASTERLVWERHGQGSHQVRLRGRQGNGVPRVKGGKTQREISLSNVTFEYNLSIIFLPAAQRHDHTEGKNLVLVVVLVYKNWGSKSLRFQQLLSILRGWDWSSLNILKSAFYQIPLTVKNLFEPSICNNNFKPQSNLQSCSVQKKTCT